MAAPNVPSAAGEMTLIKAKAEVRDALNVVQTPGNFAMWKVLQPTPAELGLHMTVNGVGSIDFPLREEQAKQIIEKSKQASFGRGKDTVVDTSVRNTWELDASKFKLLEESATVPAANKGCSHVLKTAKEHVIKELGLDCTVGTLRADSYKMLLYEKGAHFKAHTE